MAASGMLLSVLVICGGGLLVAVGITAVYFYLRDRER